MATLHLLNRGPEAGDALERMLGTATPGSAILLVGDAVYAVAHPDARGRLDAIATAGVRVAALGPDLDARGLGSIPLGDFDAVDYRGFVGLVEAFDRCVSWH